MARREHATTTSPRAASVNRGDDPSSVAPRRGLDLRRLAWLVATLSLGAVVLVAAVALAADQLDRPFGFFSREPSEVLGAPWYTGFLFHVGLLTWFASAVLALFAGAVVAGRDGRAAAAPLLVGGALCLLLSLDDGFRLHEDVAPSFLGIPKIVSYAIYAALTLGWLAAFRDWVRGTDWPLLLMAGVLLATSTVLDRVFESNQQHIFEDGVKFLGIVLWTTYFARVSFRAATQPAPRA